jgi:transcriptional regulator with XRE-family HTH domain
LKLGAEVIRIIISMESETLGARVERLRIAHRFSQRELGRRAGTSGSYISQLEAGELPRPGAKILERIADALGVTTNTLLDVDHDESAEPALKNLTDVANYFARKQGKPPVDPEELQLWVEALAGMDKAERAQQLDFYAWSAARKKRTLKRVAEDATGYKTEEDASSR